MKEALKATIKVIEAAKQDNTDIQVRAYASLAFGCPMEGDVDPLVVLDIVQAYIEAGADSILLADTNGSGQPVQCHELISRSLQLPGLKKDSLGLHMHDTNGIADQNLFQGLQLGVTDVDSSVGGIGGCSFIPGAQGNISTEKVLKLCGHSEVDFSSVDMHALEQARVFLAQALNKDLPSWEDTSLSF